MEACGVVNLAEQEAIEHGCGYIRAEHVLLGLLRQQTGVAAQVLTSLGITDDDVRARYLQLVQLTPERTPPDAPEPRPFVRLGKQRLDLPFSPRAKHVLEMSVREALTLGSAAIETEHILLGLVRERESPATQLLVDVDAELPRAEPIRPDREFDLEVRNAVIRRLTDDATHPIEPH
jgi:ATP-dependent Clp protease ATP-binding subunit ClpC